MLKLKPGLRLGAAADTVQYFGTLHGPCMKRKLTGTWGEPGSPGSSTLNGDPKRGKGSGPRPVTTMSLAGPETGRRGCDVRYCMERVSRGGSRQAAYIIGRPGLRCSPYLGNTAQPAETGVE